MSLLRATASFRNAAPWFIFVSLPLLFVPGNAGLTEIVRSLVLVMCAALIFLIPHEFERLKRSWHSLHPVVRYGVVLASSLLVSSGVFSPDGFARSIFGSAPAYIGGLQWLSIGLLALAYRKDVQKLIFDNLTERILTGVLIVSCFIDGVYVFEGERLGGLLMQATAMSFVALLTGVVSLRKFVVKDPDIWSYGALAMSVLVLMLTQSRISILCFILVAIGAVVKMKSKPGMAFIGATLLAGVILVVANPGVFARFRYEDLSTSIQYRANIYSVTTKELIDKHILVGAGPASHPEYLNDVARVPDDLAKTLNQNIVFFSSHDIYLDLGQHFGFVFLVLYVVFQLGWLGNLRRRGFSIDGWYLTIFLIAVAYSFVDVTTLELTPFIIFVTAGLYSQKHAHYYEG